MKSVLPFGLLTLMTLSTTSLFSQERPLYFDYDDRIDSFEDLYVDDDLETDADSDYEWNMLARVYREHHFTEWTTDGIIFYGDTQTEFLNEILNRVVEGAPGLEGQLYVYSLESRIPAVYLSANGRILVTTGLVARAQSESELAFAIATAVAQFKLNSFAKHLEKKGKMYDLEDMSSTEIDQYLISYVPLDENIIREADDEALRILDQGTHYSPAQGVRIMDVMSAPFAPIADVEFDPHWIFPDSMDIPFPMFEVTPTSKSIGWEGRREEKYLEFIGNRTDYLVEELLRRNAESTDRETHPQWETILRGARERELRTLMYQKDYPRALYTAYALSQFYPEEESVWHGRMGHILHLAGVYKAYEEYEDAVISYESEHPLVAGVSKFMETSRERDLMALSILWNFPLYEANPEDALRRRMIGLTIADMVQLYDMSLRDFTTNPSNQEKVDSLTQEEIDALSKIDKIRYQQALVGSDFTWSETTLYPLADNRELKNWWSKVEDASEIEGERLTVLQGRWENFNDSIFSDRSDYRDFKPEGRIAVFDPYMYVRSNTQASLNPTKNDLWHTYHARRTSYLAMQRALEALDAENIPFITYQNQPNGEEMTMYNTTARFINEQNTIGYMRAVNSLAYDMRDVARTKGFDQIVSMLHMEQRFFRIQNGLLILLLPPLVAIGGPLYTTQMDQSVLSSTVINMDDNTDALIFRERYKGRFSRLNAAQMYYDFLSPLFQ